MVKNQKRIEQIAGLILVGTIVLGCGLVLRPFISAILWAAILCFATWPVHELLLKWLRGRRNIAAGLMTALLSLVLILPFLIVGLTLSDNIRAALAQFDAYRETGIPEPPAWVERIPLVGQRVKDSWLNFSVDAKPAMDWLKPRIQTAGLWLLSHSLDFARGVFQLVISVLIAFFLYRDGVGLVARLREGFQRISGDYGQRLMEIVKTTVQSVVYGVIGTGLAQGFVAGIGFAIARVPVPLVLAVLTFFLSFVPMGPPIIWISASIWLFAQDHIGWGIFMAVYGLLAISSIDNVVKPIIISRGSKLPFVVMFIGVLGGIAAFGFIGIFIGPTLLAVGFGLIQEILGQRRLVAKSNPSPTNTPATEPAAAAEHRPEPTSEEASSD
ncbi:MAG TPA: AI-2E family transporter [Sedimentisphaerales bacterium]|nr:AI-2E family transporter [Sedimentisphaerales bacterium]